ncbi:MAG: hypothetical protein Q4A66_12735, partial [Eubacteriales bacterium]|nr:hypothetical protein [Eubacteriales bacterium]
KEKSNAGQYAGASSGDGKAFDAATNPDSTSAMIVVPSPGAMFFANKIHKAGYYPDQQVFISSQSENWEAALAWIDYMHTDEAQRMLFSGIEGVHWNYVDGVPTLTEETIAMKAAGGDPLANSGVGVTTAIRISQPAELHADGYPLSLFETDENRAASMYPAEIEYSEHYGVAYPSLARQQLVDEGKIINHSINYSQLTATAREPIPSDILRILTKCNDIVYRAIPDLVTAETQEEFDAVQAKVLADLESAGEPEAWAWMCEAQAAAHAKVDPVVLGE